MCESVQLSKASFYLLVASTTTNMRANHEHLQAVENDFVQKGSIFFLVVTYSGVDKQIAIAAFYEENVGQIPRIKVQLLYMPHIRLQQHMFEQRMQTTYYSSQRIWHSTYV